MVDRVTICSCTPWHAAAQEQLRAIGPVYGSGRRIDASHFGYAAGSILVVKARLPDAAGTYAYSVDINPTWLLGGQYEYRDLEDLAAKFWSANIINKSVLPKRGSGRRKERAATDPADPDYLRKLRVTRYDLFGDLVGSVNYWASYVSRPNVTAFSVSICKGERDRVSVGPEPQVHIVRKSANTTRIVFQDEPKHMLFGELAAFFDGGFSLCRQAGLVVGDMPYCSSDRELNQKLKAARTHKAYLACLETLTFEERQLITVWPRRDLREQIDVAFQRPYGSSPGMRANRLVKKGTAGLHFEVRGWGR